MLDVKRYCDSCGKEIDGMSDYPETEITINHYFKEADLCKSCFDSLCEKVSNFCEKGRKA